MIFSVLFFTILSFYLFIVIKRVKKYKYNQNSDYIYNLEKNFIKNIELQRNTINLEDELQKFDTLFLKIILSKNILSYFIKPYIEIESTKHYFEFGASGIRYLNISHIKNPSFSLKMQLVTLKKDSLKLYAYQNKINLSKQKVLILAPHADDAEIAAFGLYKSAKDITIVTTTIGEHGHCNYCDMYENNRIKSSLKKAQLRTIDAISIPLLGGVKIENSLTLGYFGGRLQWMSENPNKIAHSIIEGVDDMNLYRKVSHSYIDLNPSVTSTYSNFLNDLREIIKQSTPDIIITPHTTIDSHPDHKFTTFALLEVLAKIDINPKLLLYTNHLNISETYPVGPIHSPITLPPSKEDFEFDSLFSFELDKDLQIDKFFALEAIHDLRDSSLQISIKKSFKHLKRVIKRAIFSKNKSYFRRAVRANELFFVVDNIKK